MEESNNKAFGTTDERLWYPDVDKAKNGSAIIRFLPAAFVDGDDGIEFVKTFTHSFQGPTGKWLIEDCPTTIGKPCPVCEKNGELWNAGEEDLVREYKRRVSYLSNILVIKDELHPENEGEVKIFRYGKKIFDMLNDKMCPQFADEEAANPFDFWEGLTFRMRIRNVDGWRNYDKSTFDAPSVIQDMDDEAIEDLWKKQHSLLEFISEDKFLSYDALKAKRDMVLGLTEGAPPRQVLEEKEDKPVFNAQARKEEKGKSQSKKSEETAATTEDDDIFADLESLLNDDD